MLKNNKDIKSLIYIVITTSLFLFLWTQGKAMNNGLFTVLYIWFLFMSISVAVMAHNHNHLPMWKSKIMNILTDNWLTVFYGFPVFAWIPTHNANHHKFVNKEPDYTRTWRFTERNNLFTVLTYPSVSGFFQQSVVMNHFKETFSRNKYKFFLYGLQFVVLISWIAGAFIIGGWEKALIYVVLPQQLSLFSVLLFNYVQHVHADEETKYNSSRNFTGILNFLLFNNGLHTIHHIHPTIHWSEIPQEHAKIEHLIDDSLIESSFWYFLYKSYILGIFMPKYKTKSMRVARLSSAAQQQ
ncbi:fatty acid desaturase [Chitinophagales bacterium]|nr:fatty acid desaturase [Chitinophagales bacterium]